MDKIELGFLIAFFLAVSSLGLYYFIDYGQEASFYLEYDESVELGEEMILSVKDESGDPVSGAEVRVGDEKLGVTGSEGLKQLTALDSDFNISLKKEGYKGNKQEIEVYDTDLAVSIYRPRSGQEIRTFEDSEDIEFRFEINDRDWVREVKMEIEGTEHEYRRPVSSGNVYGRNFDPELEASSEGNNYTANIYLIGEEQEESFSREFQVIRVNPESDFDILEIDRDYGENWEVLINYSYESEDWANLILYIESESSETVEDYERRIFEEGNGSFERSFEEAGKHMIYGEVNYKGNKLSVLPRSQALEFETLDDKEDEGEHHDH